MNDAEIVLLAHVLKIEPGELLSGIVLAEALATARHGVGGEYSD